MRVAWPLRTVFQALRGTKVTETHSVDLRELELIRRADASVDVEATLQVCRETFAQEESELGLTPRETSMRLHSMRRMVEGIAAGGEQP